MRKHFKRGITALLCVSLIFALSPVTLTVNAKTVYKTLAFDKKIENVEKGEKRDLKTVEKDGQISMSSLDGKNGEYISPVVEAPFEALYIGLHWNEELFDGALLNAYVRTSHNGEDFSEWIKVEADT